jgi:hypothetical protein
MSHPAAAVAMVAAAPSRLTGTPATRWTGCGGSSTAVPGTSGATKNGAQYATGTAAANSRALARSLPPDQMDQMLTADSEVAIASAVTPWNRACPGQRSLKTCESFQSAATGAATVITLARLTTWCAIRLGTSFPGALVTGGSAVLPGGGAVGHQRADGPDCLWQVFTPADPALQWPPVLAAGDGVLYADPR